ncbi:S24/S26 family peptidase, partial [Candidatus Halocynthiibacter alkanivorans]|uniref:S24/S26 family peptidase n=1 Tax=Candidatus Halocynthiibacter alkanivorans TaxID=2267619 RepID=UPI003AF3DD56
MIYLRRINGNSMSPTLSNGDYIVAFRPFRMRFSVGDIVIVSHPQFSEIIKRIKDVDQQGNFWLVGDGLD